ncbi:hypothetical protein [Streptomyces luteireticuli]|uniref:hypothetical protein n=1 Tax=Streptomyces luteireticuli TaxID=173858 RepID=UPI0035572318
MTALLTAPFESGLPSALDVEFITCGDCGEPSPYVYDEDEDAAFNKGWHVFNLDDCGCPHARCPDCKDLWCGTPDDTPRLLGMRVI